MSRATSKFGDYAIHNEWQLHKSGIYQYKTAKKDRKKVGELRKQGKDTTFYIERRAEELVYAKGAWAIPTSMLTLLRCMGSPNVQIVVSNGDTYSISFADLDAKKYRIPNDPKLISFFFVNFGDFEFKKGEPESIEKTMMVGKWK